MEISSDSWLEDRIAGVWWTDGHLDLQHMHLPRLADRQRIGDPVDVRVVAPDLAGGRQRNHAPQLRMVPPLDLAVVQWPFAEPGNLRQPRDVFPPRLVRIDLNHFGRRRRDVVFRSGRTLWIDDDELHAALGEQLTPTA